MGRTGKIRPPVNGRTPRALMAVRPTSTEKNAVAACLMKAEPLRSRIGIRSRRDHRGQCGRSIARLRLYKNDPKARVNPKALTELDGSNLCSYQPVQRFGIDRVGPSKASGISLKSPKKAPEHEAAQTNLLSLLSVQILRPVLITSVLKVPFC